MKNLFHTLYMLLKPNNVNSSFIIAVSKANIYLYSIVLIITIFIIFIILTKIRKKMSYCFKIYIKYVDQLVN
jgi:hypothetical protein